MSGNNYTIDSREVFKLEQKLQKAIEIIKKQREGVDAAAEASNRMQPSLLIVGSLKFCREIKQQTDKDIEELLGSEYNTPCPESTKEL
ncbi:MAG: hypothetical protein Unbinned5081contig1003_45 [Prokaryotic dsDNA virus sp.]|nr:MAG: hypothetical protein Unbinned5081contig1003_45 [Prokaryotic dsDNA virus sp.]|tara:strand:- start:26940 stop:27203 length:264 start_codon:yes stop_codon:yes gene_type:complete